MSFKIENGVLRKYKKENGVTEVTIPEGVTNIGGSAFSHCSSLKSVTIPNSVTSIGNYAFEDCKSLTSVTIPDSVTSIGDYAFYNCKSLTSVTIPNSVTSIGYEAFYNCKSLTSVTIPDSVTSIGERAFWDCSSLASVTIPNSVTSIKWSVFHGCSSLTSITIPDSVTSIEWNAFADTKWLKLYPDDMVIINHILFKYKGSAETVVIPNNVTSIGERVFYDCKSLTSVIIPEGVTSIGDEAFLDCSSLTSVTIPDSVTSIGNCAFYGCSSLTSVTIPNSVTSIGDEAFFGCESLTSITIPDSVTTIGDRAFFACINLKEIIKSKKKARGMGKYVFLYCGSIAPVSKTTADDANFMLNKYAKRITPEMLFQYMINLKANKKTSDIISNFITKYLSYDKMAETLETLLHDEKERAKYVDAFVNYLQPHISDMSDNVQRNLYEAFTDDGDDSDLKWFRHKYMHDKPIHYANSEEEAPTREIYYIYSCYVGNNLVPVHIGDYNRSFNDAKFFEKADKVAASLNQEEFEDFIESLDIGGYKNMSGCNLKNDFPILSLYCRYSKNETVIKEIISRFKYWGSWSQYGAPGRKAIIMARGAIVLSDTQAAYDFAEKDKSLHYYANIRGTDADTLRDSRLSSYGLDENGVKVYDIGGKNIVATLQDDLSFTLFDEGAAKVVKSIPKKSDDPKKQAACAEDFKQLKKSVKSLYKQRVKLLKGDFISGNTRPVTAWVNSYMKQALLSKLARLLVWEYVDESYSRYFTVCDGKAILSDGTLFELPQNGEVGVAYPTEMSSEEVIAWQTYFLDKKLSQPFLQVWEPVRDPKTIKTDRYAGLMIPFYRFKKPDMFRIEDEEFHNIISIEICALSSDIERLSWSRHHIDPDDKFEIKTIGFGKYTRLANHTIVYLDKITLLERIETDDAAAVGEMLGDFTLAQIVEFTEKARNANAVEVLALLMDYKNKNFADVDPLEKFELDW
jgi:hypothetical protein